MVTKPTIYTEEFVMAELQSFWDAIMNDPEAFLWEELTRDKDYSRQRVSEWKKKFARNSQISDLIKKIDNEFKVRLIKLGMAVKNPAMAIFVLKNHHEMMDKVVNESEVTHKVMRAKVEIVPGQIAIKTSESDI